MAEEDLEAAFRRLGFHFLSFEPKTNFDVGECRP